MSFPIPYPPFLAFAPLDVWVRFFVQPHGSIPVRYWPRIAIGLVCSVVVTLITLPERLLYALWASLWKSRSLPGPIFILGYYRSGTTHLQFLLDRDPNLYSPKWYQALSPQGFVVSWNFLRFFMLPFLATSRPQDNVTFGSDIPAEDDFALNNWALASTLPARLMVPQAHAYYDRFHDLKDLTPSEYSRWRCCQWGLIRKLGLLAGSRRLVLKTPSHTARVKDLLELCAGTTGAKFIHISRHPHSVLRSNISMLEILNRMYGLQEPPAAEETEHYLIQEYLATEQNYLESRTLVSAGSVAEVRLQDLQADPIGEIKRIYAELGLPFTHPFEQRILEYLEATNDYTPNKHPNWTPEEAARLAPPLEPLIKLFRHDQPVIPKVDLPAPIFAKPTAKRLRYALAAACSLAATAAWMGIWLLVIGWFKTRCDPMVWPAGIVAGYATLLPVRRGCRWSGLWAALLTLAAFLGTGLCAPHFVPDYIGNEAMAPVHAALHTLLWSFMGLMSAYRIASKRWL